MRYIGVGFVLFAVVGVTSSFSLKYYYQKVAPLIFEDDYSAMGHEEYLLRKLHTRSLAHHGLLNHKASGVGTLQHGEETRAGMATPLLKFIVRLMKKGAPRLGDFILRLFRPFLPVGNRLARMGVLSKVEKSLSYPKIILKRTRIYKGTLKGTIKTKVKYPIRNSFRRLGNTASKEASIFTGKFRSKTAENSVKKKIAKTAAETKTLIRKEAKVSKISGKTAIKITVNEPKLAGNTVSKTAAKIKRYATKKNGVAGVVAPMVRSVNKGMWRSAEGKMFRTIRRVSQKKLMESVRAEHKITQLKSAEKVLQNVVREKRIAGKGVTAEHKIAKLKSAEKVLENVVREKRIAGKGLTAERTVPKSTLNTMERTDEKLMAKATKKTLTRASDIIETIAADKSTIITGEKIMKSSSSLKTNAEIKTTAKINKRSKNKNLSETPKRPGLLRRIVNYMFPESREEDVFKGPYEPPVARGSWIWDILDTIGVFDYIFGYVDEE